MFALYLIKNKNFRERLQWRCLVDMVISSSYGISEDCSHEEMQFEIGTYVTSCICMCETWPRLVLYTLQRSI